MKWQFPKWSKSQLLFGKKEKKTKRDTKDREKCWNDATENDRWTEKERGSKFGQLRFTVLAVNAANNNSPAKQLRYILKIHGRLVSAFSPYRLTPRSLLRYTELDSAQRYSTLVKKLSLYKRIVRYNNDSEVVVGGHYYAFHIFRCTSTVVTMGVHIKQCQCSKTWADCM